ncbi:restriction endonuclease, SacI family [Streptomyces synnematoformans]|uniref:Restriction endonuclease n=1 Tax=Streptomyces synnematoformans TaxID=415721 RepID=A0ABN2XJ42_9ACTN
MGITIDKDLARSAVRAAFDLAQSDRDLPEKWTHLARILREAEASRTFTPALCTALLARACDQSVDPLSIKSGFSTRTYSLRSLCHEVLVPLSVELNFDLRATGREPVNNQPFFRYDHFSEISKVRDSARPYLVRLEAALQEVDDLNYTCSDALSALAATIRVCVIAADKKQRSVAGSSLVESSLIVQTEDFVNSGEDIPRKLQACVAAGLDMVYGNVKSRRLNDPSRDVPGDVHVFMSDGIQLAVEVRGKSVSAQELEQFVRSVANVDIPRASLVVDAANHKRISNEDLLALSLERKYGRLVKINESVSSFLRDAFAWSSRSAVEILLEFPDAMYKRMSEIEVRQSELDLWADLFADDSARETSSEAADVLFGVDEAR